MSFWKYPSKMQAKSGQQKAMRLWPAVSCSTGNVKGSSFSKRK